MSDEAQLKRLTVAQLKARCQELGINGVSKLNKGQIVQKILDATPSPTVSTDTAQVPPAQPSTQPPQSPSPEDNNTSLNSSPSTAPSPVPLASAEKPAKKTKGKGTATEVADVQESVHNGGATVTKKRTRESSKKGTTGTTTRTSTTKRAKKSAGDDASTTLPSSKVSSLVATESLTPIAPSLAPTNSARTPSKTPATHVLQHSTAVSANTNASSNLTPPVTASITRPKATASATKQSAPQSSTKSSSAVYPKPHATRSGQLGVNRASTSKPRTIAKAVTTAPKFTPLTRVTTSAQKSVPPQAPARTIFPLVPLASSKKSPNGTIENRIAHIKSHFVNRLFVRLNGTRNPPILGVPFPAPYPYPADWKAGLAFPGIHPKVFASSNDEFTVAKRFWIARAHTMFQLGSALDWSTQAGGLGILSPDLSLWPPVMSCQKVIDEIYLVTTHEKAFPVVEKPTEHQEVRYLVLAKTGDIVATSRLPVEPSADSDASSLIHGCKVRPDWHAFISSALGRPMDVATAAEIPVARSGLLMAAVKTKDPGDFPSGINKAWAARTADTPQGPSLLRVAERVVLSSCMLNSFTGDQLSAMQMEAWWLNRGGAERPASNRNTKTSIELYLPEPHQVLSVHVLPPPFHPALGVVHRHSGHSDFVLLETGQVVGDEDGVSELWQGLLGCDYRGEEQDTLNFWKGWEKRVKGIE